MPGLTVTTYDWVPEAPRGFVRDLRVRWALEEAGLPYTVATVPFGDLDARLPHQPFGQVPWLEDGDATIFESGAILLHLGERHDALLPADPRLRARAVQWLFAALNSVEMAVMPWALLAFSGRREATFDDFLALRLARMEPVLAAAEWLAGGFSIADILMADVLRLVDRFDGLANHPACAAYVERATARPAFAKAHADQISLYEAADRARAAAVEAAAG